MSARVCGRIGHSRDARHTRRSACRAAAGLIHTGLLVEYSWSRDVSTFLSTDLDDPSAIPYFLWDDPMTIAEFRLRLKSSSPAEQVRLLGKLLREARDTDVWKFISPSEILARWSTLSLHLGRRRAFWEFLLNQWTQYGLIGRQ